MLHGFASERFHMLHPAQERRQGRDGPVHLADNFSTPNFRHFAISLGCLARGLRRLSVMLLLLSDDLRIGYPPLDVTVHVALPPFAGQRTPFARQVLCAIEHNMARRPPTGPCDAMRALCKGVQR